jgi:hypothetical protein
VFPTFVTFVKRLSMRNLFPFKEFFIAKEDVAAGANPLLF